MIETPDLQQLLFAITNILFSGSSSEKPHKLDHYLNLRTVWLSAQYLLRYLDFWVLMNPRTSKTRTSSQFLLHSRSYTFDCFFRTMGNIKMKCFTATYGKYFSLVFTPYCKDWKLVPGSAIILIKCQYNVTFCEV